MKNEMEEGREGEGEKRRRTEGVGSRPSPSLSLKLKGAEFFGFVCAVPMAHGPRTDVKMELSSIGAGAVAACCAPPLRPQTPPHPLPHYYSTTFVMILGKRSCVPQTTLRAKWPHKPRTASRQKVKEKNEILHYALRKTGGGGATCTWSLQRERKEGSKEEEAGRE
jgi:hypothetical protein